METAVQILEGAVSPPAAERSWLDLLNALRRVISERLTSKAEAVLVALTRFDGQLVLPESSELPHSMSPEDMLKSLAIQALAKQTGLIYLREMRRVEATTKSPVLRSIVRNTIRQAQADAKARAEAGAVKDLASDPDEGEADWQWRWSGEPVPQRPSRQLVNAPLNEVGGLTVVAPRDTRKSKQARRLQVA